MSSFYQWDSLHPSTRRGIELQPWDLDYGMNPPTLRTCGCERMREGRWSLCRYHEGVEDGTQNVDEKGLQLTITELRRKLAEGQDAHRFWSDAALLAAVKLTQAEARENALRAITGLMAPHPRVWDDAWSNCCAEWDLRASEVT